MTVNANMKPFVGDLNRLRGCRSGGAGAAVVETLARITILIVTITVQHNNANHVLSN